jgi:CDGSH-type Zn-finger protein
MGESDDFVVRDNPAELRYEILGAGRLLGEIRYPVRGLGEVFDPQARPWVKVDAADPDAIAATVLTCPTGALHFRRLDGGGQEEAPEQATIEPRPNGPLFVRGRLRLVDADGHLIRADTRLALCRCGASANKPFCDGSHRRIGFRTATPVDEGADEADPKPDGPATETGDRPAPYETGPVRSLTPNVERR